MDTKFSDSAIENLILLYLAYAEHQWPTEYSSRIDGLLFPHPNCYGFDE